MREHPYRRQIIEEMHLRRWPRVPAPGQIVQIMRIVLPDEREQERAALESLRGANEPAFAHSDRHLSGRLECGLLFAWERHTEGSSIALFADAEQSEDVLNSAVERIESLPGTIVRATRITLFKDERQAGELLPRLGFVRDEIVSSWIGDGLRFWSDFRLHESGYGRFVIAAGETDPITLSRRVQQLQELGNYRNMALLALPEVRQNWAELDRIEGQLRTFAGDVSNPDLRDDQLLERVSALTLELANHANAISYRLDATRAYAQLVDERLDDLNPIPVEGFHSLRDFARRRFLPAIRTCFAYRERLDKLSARGAELTALLRARIETRIENQNAQLLRSMERRAALQLRLQQLVEGLSIFALTYYGIGLLGYVLHGAEPDLPIETDTILAIAVPVMMAAIWLAVHRLKRRILGEE